MKFHFYALKSSLGVKFFVRSVFFHLTKQIFRFTLFKNTSEAILIENFLSKRRFDSRKASQQLQTQLFARKSAPSQTFARKTVRRARNDDFSR